LGLAGNASVVYHFPNATALLGINEIAPDVFAVVVGIVNPPTLVAGSFSVWEVDLRTFKADKHRNVLRNATDIPITAIPEAALLNGLVPLPGTPFILIADPGLAVVWRVNDKTAAYTQVLSSYLMTPPEGTVLGVNRIHIFTTYLYFTNTLKGLFGKVPIQLLGDNAGTATWDYSLVVRNGEGDDFTFDRNGNAYSAQNFDNVAQLITQDGTVSVIAGSKNSTVLEF